MRRSGWRTFSLSSREAGDRKTVNQGRIQRGRRVDNRRAAPLFSAIAVALPRLRFRSGIDNGGPFTDVGVIRERHRYSDQDLVRAPGPRRRVLGRAPAKVAGRSRRAPPGRPGPRGASTASGLVSPARRRRTEVDFAEPAAE